MDSSSVSGSKLKVNFSLTKSISRRNWLDTEDGYY